MEYKNLLINTKDLMGIITINRPEVRNAIDPETVDEIMQALHEFSKDEKVKVVIFTGSGEKSFVSGGDIKKIKERSFVESLLPGLQGLCDQIEQFEKPIIAAINGYALGGGCELAMACDIRVAAENAKFGLPELNLGIIPGAGGTQRLVRLVGKGKAKELIFTGDIITSHEAEKIGLVNKVVPLDHLMKTVFEMAQKIKNKGPLAVYLAKKSIDVGSEASQNVGMVIEKLSMSLLDTTKDKLEGTSAFLEKRAPQFKGR